MWFFEKVFEFLFFIFVHSGVSGSRKKCSDLFKREFQVRDNTILLRIGRCSVNIHFVISGMIKYATLHPH